MPFKKGDLNINRAGKGLQKKDDLNSDLKNILKSSLRAIKGKLNKLTAAQHIKLISTLMPYVSPRLQAIQLTEDDDFSNMSDEQLEIVVNRILDAYQTRKGNAGNNKPK